MDELRPKDLHDRFFKTVMKLQSLTCLNSTTSLWI